MCPTFSPILHSPATPPSRGLEGTCALPSVTDPVKRHEQESSSLGTAWVEDSRVLCTWSEVQRGTIRGTRQGPLSPWSRAVPPKVSDCLLVSPSLPSQGGDIQLFQPEVYSSHEVTLFLKMYLGQRGRLRVQLVKLQIPGLAQVMISGPQDCGIRLRALRGVCFFPSFPLPLLPPLKNK